MKLYETPDNPVPANPIVSPIRARDGLTLRVARWAQRGARGTVVIAPGRSEFCELYFGTVRSLLERGFDVVVMDWRGQGQSDREIARERRGHVSDFANYRLDLEALRTQVLAPYATRPWFAFGHSMGAAILLDQAHDGASPFERLFLTAPMIDLPLRHKAVVRLLAKLADRLGFGTRLIPGGSEESIFVKRYEGNVLTSDGRQYARLAAAIRHLPRLAVGAPTIGWLAGAFDLMGRFAADPRYAVEILTPVLIVAAGADRVVDTVATERFALRLKVGRCLTIPGARHQVFVERPSIDAQLWAAFDAFIPGEAASIGAVPVGSVPVGAVPVGAMFGDAAGAPGARSEAAAPNRSRLPRV